MTRIEETDSQVPGRTADAPTARDRELGRGDESLAGDPQEGDPQEDDAETLDDDDDEFEGDENDDEADGDDEAEEEDDPAKSAPVS